MADEFRVEPASADLLLEAFDACTFMYPLVVRHELIAAVTMNSVDQAIDSLHPLAPALCAVMGWFQRQSSDGRPGFDCCICKQHQDYDTSNIGLFVVLSMHYDEPQKRLPEAYCTAACNNCAELKDEDLQKQYGENLFGPDLVFIQQPVDGPQKPSEVIRDMKEGKKKPDLRLVSDNDTNVDDLLKKVLE